MVGLGKKRSSEDTVGEDENMQWSGYHAVITSLINSIGSPLIKPCSGPWRALVPAAGLAGFLVVLWRLLWCGLFSGQADSEREVIKCFVLHWPLGQPALLMMRPCHQRTGLDGMGSAASLDLVIRGWSIPLHPDLLPVPVPDTSLCLSPWLGKTNEREAGADPNGPQPRSCRQLCCKWAFNHSRGNWKNDKPYKTHSATLHSHAHAPGRPQIILIIALPWLPLEFFHSLAFFSLSLF